MMCVSFNWQSLATRTACGILMDRAGEMPAQIFLAGTFAQHLNLASVRGIDLIPRDVKCVQVGNASLNGALRISAMSTAERARFSAEIERARRPVELALQDDFQELVCQESEFSILNGGGKTKESKCDLSKSSTSRFWFSTAPWELFFRIAVFPMVWRPMFG